jgi:hypothetical protein
MQNIQIRYSFDNSSLINTKKSSLIFLQTHNEKTDFIIMTGESANFADVLHSGRFSTAWFWIGPSLDRRTPKSKVTAFLWCNSLTLVTQESIHKIFTKNLENWRFWKTQFFWVGHFGFFCLIPMKISQSYLGFKDGSKFWWLSVCNNLLHRVYISNVVCLMWKLDNWTTSNCDDCC